MDGFSRHCTAGWLTRAIKLSATRFPATFHEVEEELIRIAQEALSNAVHHAQASEIRLQLQYDSNSLCMRVSDDGRGFVLDEAYWGLKNMRDRAAQIRAQWKITTAEGHGTEIEVCIPARAALKKVQLQPNPKLECEYFGKQQVHSCSNFPADFHAGCSCDELEVGVERRIQRRGTHATGSQQMDLRSR